MARRRQPKKEVQEKPDINGALVGQIVSVSDIMDMVMQHHSEELKVIYHECNKRLRGVATYREAYYECLCALLPWYIEGVAPTNTAPGKLYVGSYVLLYIIYELTRHQCILNVEYVQIRCYVEPMKYSNTGKYHINVSGRTHAVLDEEWNRRYHELTSIVCRQ